MQSKAHTVLFKLATYLSKYKLTLIAASIALLFTAGVTLAMGQGVRLLIDDGFVAGSPEKLNQAALFIIGVAVLMSIGTYVRFYLVSWLGERVSADIRQSVFDHLLTLHPSYYEENRSGEIMSRLTTDTTLLETVIGSSASMALRSFLTFVGGMILMLVTNLKLSLFVLAGVPVVLLPIMLFGRRVRNLSRQSQDSIADVGSYAGEIIQQIKTVQSYTQEANEQAAFGQHVETAFNAAKRRIRQRALLIAVVISLIFSAVSAMLWVGGNDVISGVMTAGELGAFVFYAIVVAGSVATISEVIGDVQRAVGAAERLFELLSIESLIQAPVQAQPAGPLAAELKLEQVEFAYPSRPEQPALKQLNLTIPEGKSLALVGPSGAGKSTVFELLQRFYDPSAGQILLGGTDLRAFSPQDLRQQLAIVAQTPSLFSGDVFHNIRYGNPNASEDAVIAAAKAANAHEFITRLPDGYRSYLGEQGVRLSGGQKQRIAIARAILKDPRILLLDEATSALDAESEFRVQQALENLMQGRTTIIIAHRLATIRNADQIAVMQDGSIVAQGTHEELQTASPLYKRLSELQFQEQSKAHDRDHKLDAPATA
ncbi:ABC transporter ATP-binding protein [Arenicella chitinivorans]|uniref:ABC transporter ATP-binding protein n=1 Tax=Arenicella chitinivorans TaxID=1329800 RepID=A0A918REV9_9GAMM|nr:ABC transporter transmembrane domain-containing protein [Arenicella chitinivorans]GGZ97259.1 ABC transporter ATP-binding protein [Arenicella chitinivorans]